MTLDEIRNAVAFLTPGQLLRLKKYAQWRMKALGRKAAGRTYEDLLSEALTATISGHRGVRPGLDLCEHLIGAMRSISTSWRAKCEIDLYLESELPGPPDESAGPIENAATTLDPERILAAKEELARIRKAFAKDGVALEVLDGLGMGCTADEIQAHLRISADEYGAATKRIRRKLQMMFPDLNRGSRLSRGARPDLSDSSSEAYLCPFCEGRIEKIGIRETTRQPAYQWVCVGQCGSKFGPPWAAGENSTLLIGATPFRKSMKKVDRVDWSEIRDGEPFFVIAEKKGEVWEFAEKSTWECSWYPMKSTVALIAKAQGLADLSMAAAGNQSNEADETLVVIECLKLILGHGPQSISVH